MLTPADLAEIQCRTDAGTPPLLDHCRGFSAEELTRDLSAHGYGMHTLLRQWRHLIGTEDFWVGVLLGNPDVGDRYPHCRTIDDLEVAWRAVSAQTAAYIAGETAERLNEPRRFAIDDTRAEFWPAMVLLRVFTHAYHHRAQVAAMCRLLGRPVAEDMPIHFPISRTGED